MRPPRRNGVERSATNMVKVWHLSSLILFLSNTVATNQKEWRPCIELNRNFQVPCRCSVSDSIEMNCDETVLTVDNLREHPIRSISQRYSGYQHLPEDLINSGLSLRKLDLSGNLIYGLMDRLLRAQTRLEELRLADNLLGDSLNPIFSSNEFHDLRELKLLDLSNNGLRSIEEGILKGCENLEQLYLNGNSLTTIPTASLKGPMSLRVISLSGNDIESLPRGALSTVGESLLRLDLSENELSRIEEDAFLGVKQLLLLNLSRNDLSRFNSDVFKGAYNLLQLDLSANFLQEFPSDALRHLTDLKFLNISNNLISDIEQTHLSGLKELQVLDLSRNNIGRLGVNTFSSLPALLRLDLSLNALRTIEESSFEGLINLKWLSLRDNNILLVPATAFTRLPSLTHLHVEFNRIAALSTELIRATSSNLVTLGLRKNLVREIPAKLFRAFDNLLNIELSGNMLSTINSHTFEGLEDTLLNLDLSSNKLTSIGELALRNLISLNLAGNQLSEISPETFRYLEKLRYLNLSSNPLYGGFPPVFPSSVIDLDVSYTNLRILPAVLLLNLESLATLSIAGNRLKRIEAGTFRYLRNLSRIDLSDNAIEYIDSGAFVGLTNLYELNLRGNKLSKFAGEHFDTGTGLEILDLSRNRIDRLSPTVFAIHPRLRVLDLSDNRFTHFPTDLLKSQQFLEHLNLSGNTLKRIHEFAFSRIARLRVLNVSGNEIESVDELAFHNSTQLLLLDLSDNLVESFSERSMEGLSRLGHLNLRNNKLTSLPETMFDPSRVRSVESIDLSGNRFNEIPVKTLQRQSASLSRLNLARNRITQVFTQDIASNVKDFDISDNPLSRNAIRGILGEARVLRSLNLAATGINALPRLEMPFLKRLNLSGNGISVIDNTVLERTTMLETLDLSNNKLTNFTATIATLSNVLPVLRRLNVSGNDARVINESSFKGLTSLRSLDVSNLSNCTRMEKNAFKSLTKLRSLYAYAYPKLGYLDVQGILKGMNNLEVLDVEMKDSSVGNEQLAIRTHPRLRELTLRGERLRNVLSSSLVGVRGPKLTIGLKNTSVDSIPAALFFPVPRSTELILDLYGSKFTTLSGQFLAALDERSGSIKIQALENNPINCSCEAKQLWRWLKTAANANVLCAAPPHLLGHVLTSLSEKQLSCDVHPLSSPPPLSSAVTKYPSTMFGETTVVPFGKGLSEPEIIWTVAPAVQNNRDTNRYNAGDTPTIANGTDDTLIIGIVGGVVTFIAIIVIVICICRLRWSSRVDEARMAAVVSSIREPSVVRPASAYSSKLNHAHDVYVSSSTLDRGPTTPVQIMPFVQPMPLLHAQPFYGYCDNASLPMYVACSTDTKGDR